MSESKPHEDEAVRLLRNMEAEMQREFGDPTTDGCEAVDVVRLEVRAYLARKEGE